MLLRATIANLFSPSGAVDFLDRAPVAAACYLAPDRSSSVDNKFHLTRDPSAGLRADSSSLGIGLRGISGSWVERRPALLEGSAGRHPHILPAQSVGPTGGLRVNWLR
jgi:hypothetical protein